MCPAWTHQGFQDVPHQGLFASGLWRNHLCTHDKPIFYKSHQFLWHLAQKIPLNHCQKEKKGGWFWCGVRIEVPIWSWLKRRAGLVLSAAWQPWFMVHTNLTKEAHRLKPTLEVWRRGRKWSRKLHFRVKWRHISSWPHHPCSRVDTSPHCTAAVLHWVWASAQCLCLFARSQVIVQLLVFFPTCK